MLNKRNNFRSKVYAFMKDRTIGLGKLATIMKIKKYMNAETPVRTWTFFWSLFERKARNANVR